MGLHKHHLLAAACLLSLSILACEHGDQVKVWVNPSGTNWYQADIDRCIAPIVRVLNSNGIPTMSSCCGHSSTNSGYIVLTNRILIVTPAMTKKQTWKLYFRDWDAVARDNENITKSLKPRPTH